VHKGPGWGALMTEKQEREEERKELITTPAVVPCSFSSMFAPMHRHADFGSSSLYLVGAQVIVRASVVHLVSLLVFGLQCFIGKTAYFSPVTH